MADKDSYGNYQADLKPYPADPPAAIFPTYPVAGNPNTLGFTVNSVPALALDTTTGTQYFSLNGTLWMATSGGAGTLFTSAQQTLNKSQWTLPHGLGGTPSFVRAVLVSLNGDLDYPTGYEVGSECWFVAVDSLPLFAVSANATNVNVSAVVQPIGNEGQITVVQFDAAGFQMGNGNFWALKVFARI